MVMWKLLQPRWMASREIERATKGLANALTRSTSSCSMIIATYKREQLLPPLIKHLTTTPPPSLRQIVFLWQEVGAPLPDFLNSTALEQYSTSGVAVTVRMSQKNSMNERFRPLADWDQRIQTRAVMIMDDDVVVRRDAIEWGYQEWKRANDNGRGGAETGRIVGFTGRDVREKRGKWEYVVQPQETYSMVLSNAAWFKIEWLDKYWEETDEMVSLRAYVDEGQSRRSLARRLLPSLMLCRSSTVFNCDDLLINYLVSNLTHSPPLLLQPKMSLRTVPSKGLWDRNLDSKPSTDPTPSSSAPVPPVSGVIADPMQADHFATRQVCLERYFEHFAAFARLSDASIERKMIYPLIRTSTSASQDVVDHGRWLKPGEAWEEGSWAPMVTPEEEEEERQEREEFERMIDGMDDDEVIELMKQLEALEDEEDDQHQGGAFGEEEEFDDEGEGDEDVLDHDEL